MLAMTPSVLDAISKQIANEFAASFSYLSMAGWCEHHKFMGCGHWLRLQSAEEHGHGLKLFNFVLARNHQVRLAPIAQPTSDFGSVNEVFERALAQEQEVSRQGGRLTLVATPPRIAELLDMAGLDGVFERLATVEEAIAGTN